MPFIYVRINSILREYIFAFSFEPRISNIYIKFERWIKTKITTQAWSQMIFSIGHPTPWMVLTTSALGRQFVNSLEKVRNRFWKSMVDLSLLDVGVNCTEKCLACGMITFSWFCAIVFFPCGLCSGIKCVNEYERLVFLWLDHACREHWDERRVSH